MIGKILTTYSQGQLRVHRGLTIEIHADQLRASMSAPELSIQSMDEGLAFARYKFNVSLMFILGRTIPNSCAPWEIIVTADEMNGRYYVPWQVTDRGLHSEMRLTFDGLQVSVIVSRMYIDVHRIDCKPSCSASGLFVLIS
jgi:hypothetical protein